MFDLTPFGGPDPVVVELGRNGWGLVVVKKHPEVHLLLGDHEANRFKRDSRAPIVSSAAITRCGLAATPLTYEPGTRAAGCPTCIDRNGGHA